MEIILHLGAHRTASTSFQHYMRVNHSVLAAQGLGYWGPQVTRDGVLSGVIPLAGEGSSKAQLERARGRIGLLLQKAAEAGFRQLLISDENMIGAPRHNLRKASPYVDIAERMARFAYAFDGRISRVTLSLRGQESWWASLLAYGVMRGHRLPERVVRDRMASCGRSWRDVIMDLACALPGIEILVMPHEIFCGLPEERLRHMTGIVFPPREGARAWLNGSPDLAALRSAVSERGGNPARLGLGDGRWQPFDRDQKIAFSHAFAKDLNWLRAGADGIARLTEETGLIKVEANPSISQTTRGQIDGVKERRMA